MPQWIIKWVKSSQFLSAHWQCMLNFQLSSGPRLLQPLKGDFPRKHRPSWRLWKWPSRCRFQGWNGHLAGTCSCPQASHHGHGGMETRTGSVPTAKYPPVPDRPRSNFQAFSPFSTGVQSKLFSASWTPTYTHHKPQSSEPLNVLRHQSCPILIPEQLQLRSHSPFRTQPVNHHSANEQEFINPHLLDCCQLPGSAPQISRFQPYIYSRIYIYIYKTTSTLSSLPGPQNRSKTLQIPNAHLGSNFAKIKHEVKLYKEKEETGFWF